MDTLDDYSPFDLIRLYFPLSEELIRNVEDSQFSPVFDLIDQISPQASDEARLAMIEAALNELGDVQPPNSTANTMSAKQVEYDQYFVSAHGSVDLKYFIFSLLVAYRDLLRDALDHGHSLTPNEWNFLKASLDELSSLLSQHFQQKGDQNDSR